MKRYAILKYILSTVLCVSCFLTSFTSVSATDGNVLPKGDSDVITTDNQARSLCERFDLR